MDLQYADWLLGNIVNLFVCMLYLVVVDSIVRKIMGSRAPQIAPAEFHMEAHKPRIYPF